MQSRLLFVAALAGALAILIVAVVALSGGEERSFAEAPSDCVDAWNEDPVAVALGRHQSFVHGYGDVEVLMLRPDGSDAAAGDPEAHCAVVFAAGTLDAETSAAAQIQRGGRWAALSDSAAPERLGELQARAASDYNARMSEEGTIAPL